MSTSKETTVIEREIKVLNYVKEIGDFLFKENVKCVLQTQHVINVKVGKKTVRLKNNITGGKQSYVLSIKSSVKKEDKKRNDGFTNKKETNTKLTKTQYNHYRELIRLLYPKDALEYVVTKRRYVDYKGYKIDICKVGQSNKNIYMDTFIEIEEGEKFNEKKSMSFDDLMKHMVNIIPEKEIVTSTSGIRKLKVKLR